MGRGTCLDCARKHVATASQLVDEHFSVVSGGRGKVDLWEQKVAQARILLDEALAGYPFHRWHAVGALAMAESIIPATQEKDLRTARLQVMNGDLALAASTLAMVIDPPKEYLALAVAHLAEAVSECRMECPQLARQILQAQIDLALGGPEPNFDDLIILVCIEANPEGEDLKVHPNNSKKFKAIEEVVLPVEDDARAEVEGIDFRH